MRKQILTVALVILFLVMVFAPIAKTETEQSPLDQLRDAGPGFYLFIRADDGRTLLGRITEWTGTIHTVPVEKKPVIERAGGGV